MDGDVDADDDDDDDGYDHKIILGLLIEGREATSVINNWKEL